MATAIDRLPPIDLEVNVPQVLSFRFIEPKKVRFGVMFGTMDRRPLFLSEQDGSDFYRSLVDLNYQPGQAVKVMKVGNPGGYAYRVRPAQLDEALTQSVANEAAKKKQPARKPMSKAIAMTDAQADALGLGPAGGDEPPAPTWDELQAHQTAADSKKAAGGAEPTGSQSNGSAALRYAGPYKLASDVLIETQAYLKGKGVLVEIRMEDVRCLAATIIINAGGGR